MSATILKNTSTTFARLLAPVPPFDSPSLPNVSTLDILGALRLSFVIRQMRRDAGGKQAGMWWHDLWVTLVVVFGGEMIIAAMLNVPPSFMLSPTIPALFIFSHAAVQLLPSSLLPTFSLETELPLSLLDALTRSMLVCDGASNLLATNPNPLLRSSPMALLITSTVLGNVGFFVVNVFNMLGPHEEGQGWKVRTPPELGPYGWTGTDLWIAPLMSGVYATLTHLQPFWVDVQRAVFNSSPFIVKYLSQSDDKASTFKLGQGVLEPLSPAVARSVCALIMAAIFATRAVKNFWGQAVQKASVNAKTRKAQGQMRAVSVPPVNPPVVGGYVGKKRPVSKVKKEPSA